VIPSDAGGGRQRGGNDFGPVNLPRPARTLLVLQTGHAPILVPATPGEDRGNRDADLPGYL
jgi:hypothetical protein